MNKNNTNDSKQYDVIVIGAGHAGCEAAMATARLGSRTLLVTMDMNRIAQMSCNPAIGGIAKGQIVREIDALGGQMGIVSDASAIQFRLLNRSKGPAMWSPRAQCDRIQFVDKWRSILERQENLYIIQDEVKTLLISDKQVSGIRTVFGAEIKAKSVILTAGTFLRGLMHFGDLQIEGGRIAEFSSIGLSDQLKDLGFRIGRMKTGTPPRIDARSIHLEECTPQHGDNDFHRFSFIDSPLRILRQRPCYTTYTNEECHQILRRSLDKSPLYNGQIQSVGPRYCPSIETKIVTFADKSLHQLFLEPEGENTTEYYINGFSSSMPTEVQLTALRAIPALRDVHIFRPGYAIEYDYFDPTQLKPTLESMLLSGLFLAGQVNGTTGYEEAGGQGIVAGINAHLNTCGDDEFVLGRDEAYIGVLIDDLITKGVDEPYRMFTSRAEYRILLRQDNTDVRLTPLSQRIGLAQTDRWERLQEKQQQRDDLIQFVEQYEVKPENINQYMQSSGQSPIRNKCKLKDLIVRPQFSFETLQHLFPSLQQQLDKINTRREEVIEAAEILLKYEGYIEREKAQAEKLQRLESVRIPANIAYNEINAISIEARQKLTTIKPKTIGQASRIPGISPHDIGVLLVFCGR